MALTNDDFDRLRQQLEMKINSVSVDHVNMAQAIGSYGERFSGVDARIDAVDARLNGVESRLDGVDSRLNSMDRRLDSIDLRLDALSSDMDRRFTEMNHRFGLVQGDIARLDRRIDLLDAKLDSRFNLQTYLMAALGALVLFADPLRTLLGF